jgi:hypothetical protein
MNACLVNEPVFTNNKCYVLSGSFLPFLVCLFNSALFNKLMLSDANATGGKGPAFMLSQHVPIPNQQVLETCKDLISKPSGIDEESSIEIDNLIFKLYRLSDEEIACISALSSL